MLDKHRRIHRRASRWPGYLLALLILVCSIPAPALASAPEKASEAHPSPPPPAEGRDDGQPREAIVTYVVQEGDTVYDLAKRFGLRPETIIGANEALMGRPDRLRIGQRLRILPLDGAYYLVRTGDTLSALARRFGVIVEDIVRCSYNQIEDPDRLRVGTALIIPGATATADVPRRLYHRGPLPADARQGTGTYVWPLRGYITQKYHKGHRALDIGAPTGRPVRAVDSGFVVQTAWDDSGYGHCIVIDHGNGVRTRYAHLSAYHVSAGESVEQGQVIGEVGKTGRATGPHLHLEIIVRGVRQDPLDYLPD